MKKEIITITGTLGSGKSSTADILAKKLDYKRFSSGDFMRKIALEMGVSLNELQTKAETDFSIDEKIDNEVKKVAEMNKIILDSRLAFHWIPESFKVYLNLPPEIAKERILKDLEVNKLRKESENSNSPEEIYQKITDRLESEKKRYMELYGVNHTNQNQYDLVVDTNKYNLEQVVEMILSEYKKWQNN